jgi:ABC-type cobalamin transport system permease subunit
MPRLVRMYVDNVLIGFAVAIAFVVGLIVLDIGHLGSLVLASDQAVLATAMLVLPFGTLFGSVQFALAVMALPSQEERPGRDREDR